MDETLDTLGKTIAAALPNAVTGTAIAHHELNVAAKASDIVAVMRFLRDDPRCQFVCLIDVTAVDYPSRDQRFDVVYHLLSPKLNLRIRVKVPTDENAAVPSIIEVFPATEWFEREVYDLYGVVFTGHPDMRRLLTDYGFEGHPLRKDFPLTGDRRALDIDRHRHAGQRRGEMADIDVDAEAALARIEMRRQQLRAHPFHQHDHVAGGEHFWHRRDLRRFRIGVRDRLVLRHRVGEAMRHAGLERRLHRYDPCPGVFAFSSPGST